MTYTAGFTTLPGDLKVAAARLMLELYSENARDPNIKREKVEGVGETEYWGRFRISRHYLWTCANC